MAFTVKYITNGFPHPTFDHITGQPNQKKLMEFHKNLYKNALYVHSNLVEGNHGLLVIIIGAQDCLSQMVHAFISPINPGHYLNILAHTT